jgi:methyl-accepting chemotaxis protein
MTKMHFKKTLGIKITLTFLIITLLNVGILSTVMYKQSYNMFIHNVGKKALAITKIAVETINIEEFKEFKTSDDMHKDSYKKNIAQLDFIRKIGGAKYLYVLKKNKDGNFIYIFDTAYNQEEVCDVGEIENDESYELAWQGKEFFEDEIWIDEKWGAMLCAFCPLKDKNGEIVGIIGIDYDAEQEYITFQKLKKTILILSLTVLIVISLLGILIFNKLSKPIKKIASLSDKIANHDYKIEHINVKNKDEIGLLANNFNKMIKNTKSQIYSIKNIIHKLKNSSEIIATSSVELSASCENISKTIQDVASSTAVQASETNNSLIITNNLSEKIENILDKLNIAVINATDMKEKNQLGIKSITELDSSFNKDVQARISVRKGIQQLAEKSNSIGKIAETIKSIAEQTNLLALNASIEAASAGEHGKGFAVVANEVKKLAEQSSFATKEIENTIEEIINIINTANDTMNAAKVIADNSDNHLNQTKEVFNKITLSADKVINQIQLLHKDINYVTSAKDDVLKSMENISSVSNQSATATEEISASSQDQAVFIEEVSKSIQELNNMINKLSELVQIFNI